jgi:hypothetical protein
MLLLFLGIIEVERGGISGGTPGYNELIGTLS